MKKSSKRNGLVAGALALTMAATGVFAYLIDTDYKTNVFTLGEGLSGKVTLTEPSWVENNAKDILPLDVLAKDPTITNNSEINVYGFITVDVPTANVSINEENGLESAEAERELFTYSVNAGWKEVTTENHPSSVTHVYAYAGDTNMTAITPTASQTLFDEVTLINIAEGNTTEGSTQNIKVKSYAIQADGLTDTTPSAVWALVYNATTN